MFRDGATILADFAQLAQHGKTPRPGASVVAVPTEFRASISQTALYLTADQRTKADHLAGEMRSWHTFLQHSPKIISSADHDIQTVTAIQKDRLLPGTRITLTPTGKNKLSRFTTIHRKEVIGVVINAEQPGVSLVIAPTTAVPITGGTMEISQPGI